MNNQTNEEFLVVRPKHQKGEDGFKVFSIRIKEETVNKIDEISNQTGRSRNELIGTFLDFALQRCIIEK